MNFSELETLMSSRGVTTLAEIARTVNTTPQAVSNWKARDQVPHHIAAKLSQLPPTGNPQTPDGPAIHSSPITHYVSPNIYEEDTISLSDILLTMAEQLKVIILATFISVFLTFTYVQFIQKPQYVSWATVLLPQNKMGNLGGLAGLASQFGVNIPAGSQADLSSPSLFPELLRSRTFAEQILDQQFYTNAFGKELSLLAILTHGNETPKISRDNLVTTALSSLEKTITFEQDPSSTFSVIKVTANEPMFAKELAEVVLTELEALNRFFRSQTLNEKTSFIIQRIHSVEGDLEGSEQALKIFNEKNRQISSPALQLEQERLTRDVEIQKGIFLTLKQQLELAKIEEVQESSIVQILDMPQMPLRPFNKNIKLSLLLGSILGIALGILFSFIRSYLEGSDKEERKKLRRLKYFLKKKSKDIFLDQRFIGIISLFLLIGLPFYLGHESKNPVYFDRYSPTFMLVNIIYIFTLFLSIGLFIYITKKK
jgi:uncharacterized protein involved in exopolysaccharide biosynthesis